MKRGVVLLAVSLVISGLPAFADGLTVKSLQLAFDDGKDVTVSRRGEKITAFAEVAFEGSGTLRALWEIAEPTRRGQPGKFRRLAEVEKQLAAGGVERMESPELPNGSTGTYAIRFSISAPAPVRNSLARYFVGETPSEEVLGGRRKVPEAIGTKSPSESVGQETSFSWDPVPGSIGYQVEIYEETGREGGLVAEAGTFGTCLIRTPSALDRPPLVGLMAPGYQTKATITELAGTTLTSGRAYLWRVVALGARGKVLCESPFRRFTYEAR